jgi:hypothetical protein
VGDELVSERLPVRVKFDTVVSTLNESGMTADEDRSIRVKVKFDKQVCYPPR